MERADKILKENIHTLHRMSLELLVRETLTAAEIDIIIAGGTLPPFEKKTVVEKAKEKFTIADNIKLPPLEDLGGIAAMPA